jgi:pimeloyl-[acyl-carrier protein] methyl ester esterase
MLPGLDGTGLLFKPAVRTCPRELEPLVQDLPAQEPLDYRALSDRIAVVLPSDEPFVLLGESFSGPLALELAARRPAGLLGVVLVATFVTPPNPGWLSFLPWSFIFRFSPPGFIVRRYFIGRRGTEELLGLLQQIPDLVAPDVMALRVRLVSSVDARRALKLCPTPILYLQANEDRLVHQRALAEILRVRPDVEHRCIDSPHFVAQVAPDEVWGHILPFVRGLQRAF